MGSNNGTEHGSGADRRIGAVGTTARVLGGSVLIGLAAVSTPTQSEILLGVVGFPVLAIIAHGLFGRAVGEPISITGPTAMLSTTGVFLALYLTPLYARSFAVTSVAVLIFYGMVMLIAAWRGYAGCEVLALSNLILGRDDHISCLLYSPIDRLDRRGQS